MPIIPAFLALEDVDQEPQNEFKSSMGCRTLSQKKGGEGKCCYREAWETHQVTSDL